MNTHNLMRSLVSLNVLYDGMPTTSGCERCSEHNGDDVHWCCKENTPSMYYAEFMNVWKHVKTWRQKRQRDVVIRAFKNYLSNRTNKRCIFYDNGCTVYQQRPMYCRLYAVIPESSWNRKTESLKQRGIEVRPQCSLVSSSRPITDKQEDKWFAHLAQCERTLGVPEDIIQKHDGAGGSYRTFHDHVMMETFPVESLEQLSQVRLTNPSDDEINSTVDKIAGIEWSQEASAPCQ